MLAQLHPLPWLPPTLTIQSRREFIMNTILPQGIGAVGLISDGTLRGIVFMMDSRPYAIRTNRSISDLGFTRTASPFGGGLSR